MSRSTALTPKENFIITFQNSERFDQWIDFANNASTLFAEKFALIKKDVIEFDELHSIKADMDGVDYYYDEIKSFSYSEELLLPLAFIGAFNSFEKYLKVYCSQLTKFHQISLQRSIRHDEKYLHHVKTYLKNNNVIDIYTNDKLSTLWNSIDDYKELRNLLAHNDNPIDTTDHTRFSKVNRIPLITISSDRNVSIDNKNVIANACALYSEFITELTAEIASNKF